MSFDLSEPEKPPPWDSLPDDLVPKRICDMIAVTAKSVEDAVRTMSTVEDVLEKAFRSGGRAKYLLRLAYYDELLSAAVAEHKRDRRVNFSFRVVKILTSAVVATALAKGYHL